MKHRVVFALPSLSPAPSMVSREDKLWELGRSRLFSFQERVVKATKKNSLNENKERCVVTIVQLYIYRVPKKNVSAFLRIQKAAGRLYKKYGALHDETFKPFNLEPKYGCIAFPNVLDTKDDEQIFFSVSRFDNKAHEDQVMAKVNADKRINGLFDQVTHLIEINRVIRGEFELVT